MIKYRDKAKITIGEIIFLIATIALFIGHFINSNIFHNYYLFANFGLAFCYLFMAQFVLNPEGELDYKIPIIAGIGMFSILLSIPRWLRLYSSDLWFVMFMSFLLFLVPLLYYLISKRGILRDFYLELILIRFGIILIIGGTFFLVPTKVPPIETIKMAYIGENELLRTRYDYSKARQLSKRALSNDRFSEAYFWLDSAKTLKINEEALTSNGDYEAILQRYDNFEKQAKQLGRLSTLDLFWTKQKIGFIPVESKFGEIYNTLFETCIIYSIQLRNQQHYEKSNEVLNSCKMYFKIIYLIKEWESDYLFFIYRGLQGNHYDLNNLDTAYYYYELSQDEFDRVGHIKPYWKALSMLDMARMFEYSDQFDKAIKLLEKTISYLDNQILNERLKQLLEEVKENLEKLKEPELWRVM